DRHLLFLRDTSRTHLYTLSPHDALPISMMSAHFCAVVPNFRIMEIDPDRVPWYDDLVTVRPEVAQGSLVLPAGPGWGTEVNEERSEEHTSELQSRGHLVCRLLLVKKKHR